jgi:hypothetical protein
MNAKEAKELAIINHKRLEEEKYKEMLTRIENTANNGGLFMFVNIFDISDFIISNLEKLGYKIKKDEDGYTISWWHK